MMSSFRAERLALIRQVHQKRLFEKRRRFKRRAARANIAGQALQRVLGSTPREVTPQELNALGTETANPLAFEGKAGFVNYGDRPVSLLDDPTDDEDTA